MTLPDPVRVAVESALGDRPGHGQRITGTASVGGGCISPVARVTTASGDRFFLKWSTPDHPDGLLAAEARGLRRLAVTGTVRVPTVVASEADWLLLEWLEPGSGGAEGWERLGRDLAALHRHRDDHFGADADNFIGSLPQANDRSLEWAEFWRSHRLEPQLRMAADSGHFDGNDRARFGRLLSALDGILGVGDDEGPSVLHGDLWGGNVHFTAGGAPALVDPSVYHGHREVDLAMSELFGGFGERFQQAYREAWPLADGYAPARRAVYQLYYLLVHVNLFGASYVTGCRNALRQAGF